MGQKLSAAPLELGVPRLSSRCLLRNHYMSCVTKRTLSKRNGQKNLKDIEAVVRTQLYFYSLELLGVQMNSSLRRALKLETFDFAL